MKFLLKTDNQILAFTQTLPSAMLRQLPRCHLQLTDPCIRLFFQARNFMEFLETIARQKADEDESF
jgi:hypothetical protein